MLILTLIILLFLYLRYEIKFDYTKEKKLLLWYTYKSNRKYWVLW